MPTTIQVDGINATFEHGSLRCDDDTLLAKLIHASGSLIMMDTGVDMDYQRAEFCIKVLGGQILVPSTVLRQK